MKITTISTLLCAVVLLFGTACERASISDIHNAEVVELTGANYLESHRIPPVVFHYSTTLLETGATKGWLIDNKGTLRTYEMDRKPLGFQNRVVSESAMKLLVENSTEIDNIGDLETFVKNYKSTRTVITQGLKVEKAENPTALTETSYASSFLHYPQAAENSCTGFSSTTHFQQIILDKEGVSGMRMDHNLAGTLISYMKEFHPEGL